MVFFLGPPLTGFDEEYSTKNSNSSNGDEEVVQFPEQAPFNWTIVRRRMKLARYVSIRRSSSSATTTTNTTTSTSSHQTTQVDWDMFKYDIERMYRNAMTRDTHPGEATPGTLRHASSKILNVMEQLCAKTGQRQRTETDKDEGYHKFQPLLTDNYEPAMQGTWRKTAYPERRYQRLPSSSVLCDGLVAIQDQRSAIYEMQTPLPDSFVGLSYCYNDNGQSEDWMKSVTQNDLTKVIKAQVRTTMDILLLSVQDRVMTEQNILHKPEVQSANWLDGNRLITTNTNTNSQDSSENKPHHHLHISNSSSVTATSASTSFHPQVAEQPVWGIDCYTRKNISSCIETEFSSQVAFQFIEKLLLPAINSCPVDVAHNMNCAARILEGFISTKNKDKEGEQKCHEFLNEALTQKKIIDLDHHG